MPGPGSANDHEIVELAPPARLRPRCRSRARPGIAGSGLPLTAHLAEHVLRRSARLRSASQWHRRSPPSCSESTRSGTCELDAVAFRRRIDDIRPRIRHYVPFCPTFSDSQRAPRQTCSTASARVGPSGRGRRGRRRGRRVRARARRGCRRRSCARSGCAATPGRARRPARRSPRPSRRSARAVSESRRRCRRCRRHRAGAGGDGGHLVLCSVGAGPGPRTQKNAPGSRARGVDRC